jgi:hypothetical protein
LRFINPHYQPGLIDFNGFTYKALPAISLTTFDVIAKPKTVEGFTSAMHTSKALLLIVLAFAAICAGTL